MELYLDIVFIFICLDNASYGYLYDIFKQNIVLIGRKDGSLLILLFSD